MPISSSETRTKWKKRKREPRKPKQPQDDDVLEDGGAEDEDDNDFDPNSNEADDDQQNQNPSFGADRGSRLRESEALFNGSERICEFPLVIRRQVSRPHSSIMAIAATEKAAMNGDNRGQTSGFQLENISYGQHQVRSTVSFDSPIGGSEDKVEGPFVITPPRILEGRGIVKQLGSAGRVHVVPMHADWFSPNSVYRLEKQVVPHYFSEKSVEHTPDKYMQCRNWIIAKYMENPEKQLSINDCEGIIGGVSKDDVTRIVRFLDHWGIINYCANTTISRPHKEGECLCEDSQGELCVPSMTLKSIDSLIKFDRPKCRVKARDIYTDYKSYNNDNDEDIDYDSTIREQLSDNRCNYCCKPVSLVYYQSNKEVEVLLCVDCYSDGAFVNGHSSLDFVKVHGNVGQNDGEKWSDEETLLLLEGMQLYNERWNEIAEHVGTKSKAQCILHFVGISVDGVPLQNIEVPSTSKSSQISNGNHAGTSTQTVNSDTRFPFANSGNPVMSLVSFLASAMGPRVAAACAHASLAALANDTSNSTETNNSNPLKEDTIIGGGGGSPFSSSKMLEAAKAGLAAAATKAKLFADHEEREIQRLSANVINHQLKRLELKLKQFAEVETFLMKECETMERTRQRGASERAHMLNRQAQIPGPQGGVGGFIHPHMSSLMSQQQQGGGGGMYGLGQRLPLSALHPSSSPSNPLFSSPSNSQPTHPLMRPLSGGAKSGLG